MILGVNIDHIATLREARKIHEPNPLEAVFIVKNAGAEQVTIHLREDRRHIHEDDVRAIIQQSILPVNVESSINPKILDILKSLRPERITFVPEKREEVTTEGGLDCVKYFDVLNKEMSDLRELSIKTSLFIDPDMTQINAAKELKADAIEIHTGHFANVHAMLQSNLAQHKNCINNLKNVKDSDLTESIMTIKSAALYAKESNLEVYAGHGLNYQNVHHIANIKEITELNIGHSIIARAVFVGLHTAIKDMKDLLKK